MTGGRTRQLCNQRDCKCFVINAILHRKQYELNGILLNISRLQRVITPFLSITNSLLPDFSLSGTLFPG